MAVRNKQILYLCAQRLASGRSVEPITHFFWLSLTLSIVIPTLRAATNTIYVPYTFVASSLPESGLAHSHRPSCSARPLLPPFNVYTHGLLFALGSERRSRSYRIPIRKTRDCSQTPSLLDAKQAPPFRSRSQGPSLACPANISFGSRRRYLSSFVVQYLTKALGPGRA